MGEEQKRQEQNDAKTEELISTLEEERIRSEEYLTRLKYAQADFENLKKRLDRQLEEAKRYCNERLVVELLGIVDELEMAIKSSRSSKANETLIQGVEMTLRKLRKTLESEGVSPIECVGKPFDPTRHAAVAKVEKGDVDDCTVIEEVRKGYTMGEKVIRPSIVKVSVRPSSQSQKEECSDE